MKKRTNKFVFLIIIVLILNVLLVYFLAKLFSPGSYIETKKYDINLSQDILIKKIHRLKEIDSTLILPAKYDWNEGPRDKNDYWYHIFFYNKKDKLVLNCWVRSKSKFSSTFAIVSTMDDKQNWRELDKNMGTKEKNRILTFFENRIINKLKLIPNK
jgi:hypothetical protein